MKAMTEALAREILGATIQANDWLDHGQNFTHWIPSNDRITLDGAFTPDELQAIAWWMQNKRQQAPPPSS